MWKKSVLYFSRKVNLLIVTTKARELGVGEEGEGNEGKFFAWRREKWVCFKWNVFCLYFNNMFQNSLKILTVIQECRESTSSGQWCSCWFETSLQGDFSCRPWNMGLLEFSHQLVYCSSLVSRAAPWYFIHSDNYIIIANRVKGDQNNAAQ